MEVRARSSSCMESKASLASAREDNSKSRRSIGARIMRELAEIGRVSIRMLKGQGSTLSYLFIPALISIFWLILCLLTTKNPSMSLEERLSQKYLREYFEAKSFEEGLIEIDHEDHQPVFLPEGESLNVVMAIPFLDVNPLGATEYMSALEWILIYSTVPITFHVITNTDSISYVERIFGKVNATANCHFDYEIITLASLMDLTATNICPKMTVSDDFCDILVGKMTPLLFPYIFPEISEAIYIDRNIVFQDNIGHLYKILQKMKKNREAIGMAPEQTNTYMRAFGGWQRINPSTKLGRPPPDGKPGYNPDLILMDLEKLRSSASFKSYFNERRLNKLIKNYLYHSSADIPSLGDMVNLMAADNEHMFLQLGCEWNRNSKPSSDFLDKKFNVCPKVHHIRAWNGNPNHERISQQKEMGISIGKKRIDEDELR